MVQIFLGDSLAATEPRAFDHTYSRLILRWDDAVWATRIPLPGPEQTSPPQPGPDHIHYQAATHPGHPATNRGMSLAAIAAMLSHRSMDMTLRYAKAAGPASAVLLGLQRVRRGR